MRRKKYLVISFLIAVPLFLGLYLNYLLNNLVNGLYIPLIPAPVISPVGPPGADNTPGPVGDHVNPSGQANPKTILGQSQTENDEIDNVISKLPYYNKDGAVSDLPSPGDNNTTRPLPSEPGDNDNKNSNSNGSSTSPSDTEKIVSGVQEQLEKPVEKKDLLKAGMVIMRKLSWEEINFLYTVGTKEQRSVEEQKQTREILLNKLSTEEIAILRALGEKYGKKLNILDPNVPIR